jgi:hypothetical protein
MKNIKTTIKDNILHIEVDLKQTQGKSNSGKTTIIATSEGNQTISTNPEIKMGLNIFQK